MERTPIPAAALAVLASIALATAAPLRGAAVGQQGVQFRSGVDVVTLSVTVRDENGQIRRDLTQADFEVFEDGVRQEIVLAGQDEVPISVVVLLDASGSMMGDKMMHAKDGVIEFVKALQPRDEALVIAFSDSVDALGGFGLDARRIERAVKGVDAGASTRLYDAVIEGAKAIAAPGRKEKRALLVLSDGADTSSTAQLNEAVEAVRRAQVPVYAIAIEYSDAFSARPPSDSLWRPLRGASEVEPLRRLTDGTGGWTYSIPAAKRCKEICLRIAAELRSQYLLGYYPSNKDHDGRWHQIEVRTPRPGLTLATRNGYYAPRE